MKSFLSLCKSSLSQKYTQSEIQIFANLILGKVTGLSATQLLVNKDLQLSESEFNVATHFLDRLTRNEPIQYIIGETEFYGLKFEVGLGVLIPRPETEELVEWVLDELQPEKSKFLLDIGTGSGCIAIALKSKFTDAQVFAMDISAEALEIANANAQRNKLEISFLKENILAPRFSEQKWDVIVSNPPYIPVSEREGMDKNVTEYEPDLALFVEDENPLIFYEKIVEYAVSQLNKDGRLYVETHRESARQVAELMRRFGFCQVEVRTDLSGNERMVRGVMQSK